MVKGYLPYGAAGRSVEELEAAGCQQIVSEQASGTRTAWEKLTSGLQDGDVLVICNAAHAGTQSEFIQTLIQVGVRHAHLVSLAEDIDTLRDSFILNSEAIR